MDHLHADAMWPAASCSHCHASCGNLAFFELLWSGLLSQWKVTLSPCFSCLAWSLCCSGKVSTQSHQLFHSRTADASDCTGPHWWRDENGDLDPSELSCLVFQKETQMWSQITSLESAFKPGLGGCFTSKGSKSKSTFLRKTISYLRSHQGSWLIKPHLNSQPPPSLPHLWVLREKHLAEQRL